MRSAVPTRKSDSDTKTQVHRRGGESFVVDICGVPNGAHASARKNKIHCLFGTTETRFLFHAGLPGCHSKAVPAAAEAYSFIAGRYLQKEELSCCGWGESN